ERWRTSTIIRVANDRRGPRCWGDTAWKPLTPSSSNAGWRGSRPPPAPVHNRAGEVVRSAFAVGPDLVATCAHVVATATGADPYAAVAPGETRGRLPDAVR